MDYVISDASARHLEALEELEKRCFSVPWTREQLESQLPDEQHCFLVAESSGGELLGYVGMMLILDEGYISNVAVAPAARRQGIADRLIAELLRRAETLALAFVTREVRAGNVPAIARYEKHGFRTVGLRRGYYEAPREDALLMTKRLDEAKDI